MHLVLISFVLLFNAAHLEKQKELKFIFISPLGRKLGFVANPKVGHQNVPSDRSRPHAHAVIIYCHQCFTTRCTELHLKSKSWSGTMVVTRLRRFLRAISKHVDSAVFASHGQRWRFFSFVFIVTGCKLCRVYNMKPGWTVLGVHLIWCVCHSLGNLQLFVQLLHFSSLLISVQ